MAIRIEKIERDKSTFLDLLLLADEQESMIYRYLERGEMFALFDGGLKSVGVVTMEGPDTCELKNIATKPGFQRKGYGTRLLTYLIAHFKSYCKTMYVGTGDNAGVGSFYEKFGFAYSHRVPNFFTEHYHEPIFESGRQLVDMVYFKKDLSTDCAIT
jgi:ribosomal protein S18 acetylase RimI-like enzyme